MSLARAMASCFGQMRLPGRRWTRRQCRAQGPSRGRLRAPPGISPRRSDKIRHPREELSGWTTSLLTREKRLRGARSWRAAPTPSTLPWWTGRLFLSPRASRGTYRATHGAPSERSTDTVRPGSHSSLDPPLDPSLGPRAGPPPSAASSSSWGSHALLKPSFHALNTGRPFYSEAEQAIRFTAGK